MRERGIGAAAARVAFVSALAAGLWSAPSVSQAEPGPVSQLNWIFDGKVHAATRVGNTLYVGGAFRSVAPSSGALGSVHAVSTTTGAAASPAAFPVIDGAVRVILPDGNGGFYVGGGFSTVGGVGQSNLVHVLADGTRDPVFAPQVDNVVTELARSGNALFISGFFSAVGGQPRQRLAEIDATTGAVRSFAPLLPGLFTPGALDVVGSRLVVGASAGVAEPNLFAFDVATGALLWQRAVGNGGLITDFASAGARVFVAGNFIIPGASSGIAAFDPSTGNIDTSWSPGGGAQFVSAITSVGSTVYVAGSFTTLAGQPRAGLGALDAVSGALLAWNPALAGFFTSMVTLPNGNVVVSSAPLGAEQDLRQIDPTGTVTAWRSAVSVSTVTALAADASGRLAVGTPVGATASTPRGNLAAFDLTSGALLPWAPSTNGPVYGMATDGDRVFIGGGFSQVSGVERAGLASLTLVAGDLNLWDPRASGAFRQIVGLTADATHLYVHGSFSVSDRDTTVANLARFDLRGGLLDVSWVPAVDFVRALAVGADEVYASGVRAGIATREPAVFALDRATARARPWRATLGGGDAIALALDGDTLYVGGFFGTVNGVPRGNLAAVDRRSGATLGFNPGFFNLQGMTVADGLVIVVGYVGSFVALPAARLVALRGDGAATPWAPPYTQTLSGGSAATAVLAAGDRLIVTGGFGTLTPTPLQGLAVFPLDGVGGPTALRSTPRGAETMLSWTPTSPTSPAGYVLEAGTTPDNLNLSLPVGPATTFAAVLPPQSYFVRVRPSGTSGAAAAPSNEVMVRGGCAGPPGAPLGLEVSVSGAAVQLSWRQGEGLASRYHLLAGTAPGLADIATIVLLSDQTSFAAQAPPGTYHVRVQTENACGVGIPSASVSFVVGGATALPPAPTFLGGSAAGSTVSLTWAPPPPGVTGHLIEAGTASGLADLGAFATSATSSFIATGVPPGVYVVRVRATNAAGTGPPSADVVIRVP